MKKQINKNLTYFEDFLDQQYGKRGTEKREAYEQEFEAFKIRHTYSGSAGKK